MSSDDSVNGGWLRYQKLVLAELERLDQSIKALSANVAVLQTEIALLKLKSSVWGFGAGMVPSVAVLIYFWVTQ